MLVGLDENDTDFNAVGKEGGSKTHTLTKAELPDEKIMLNVKRAGSGVNETRQWGVNTQILDNMGDDFTEPLGDGEAFSIQNRYKVVRLYVD